VKSKVGFDPAFIFLLIVSAVLIFTHLGLASLWEDEAETALVAQTIPVCGIPKITDGTNYFYQEHGKQVGYGDIWAWTPWLAFYVVATSTQLLGTSQWVLRFPFALAGFLTIIFTFRSSIKLFGRQTALLSTLLLISSVPFLLYVRQCRYYALVILGTLWAMDSLVHLKREQKWFNFSLFCALFIVFHANYISWFSLLGSISVFAFFPVMTRFRKEILTTLSLAVLVNLPWFLLFKPLHEKMRDFDVGVLIETIIFYVESMNHYVIPFALLLFIPLVLRVLPKKQNEAVLSRDQITWIYFLIILMIATIFFSLLGPAPVFRYLVGIIPISILLFSVLLMKLWQRSKMTASLIILVFIFSNFFHIFFYSSAAHIFPFSSRHLKGKLTLPLISYIQELIHPPHGSVKKIADYLNLHASSKDLVIATYGDLPLKFYTGLRVIGGLALEALEEAKNADWVITRKVLISDEDARVMVYLIDNLDWERYEKINLGQTDFPWDNIPEPSAHQFKSLDFNPEWQIQIYRKLKPEEASRAPDPPKMFYFTPMQKAVIGTYELKRELTHYLLWLKEQTFHPGKA